MKKYLWCILLSIPLLILAALGVVLSWCWYPERIPPIPVAFLVPAAGRSETISCWTEDGARYYVFLPSYARLEQVQTQVDSASHIELNGIPLTDGADCEGLRLNERYPFCVDGKQCSLEFVQSKHVASIYIETESGNMNRIHKDKANRETISVTAYTPDGRLDYSSVNTDTIKGRGNSTWKKDKKPYNIICSEPQKLLGMAEGEKWCLLANAGDATNLRNWIVYGLANQVGFQWSPDTVFTDLYLNGEYAGLYLLVEAVTMEENRVNLPENGYLLDLEHRGRLNFEEDHVFVTEYEQGAEIKYPAPINNVQAAKLYHYVDSMERAITSPDGTDPVTGASWSELIDLDSWVRRYLVDEISENFDSSIVSQYFSLDYDADGILRLYAGPVWDCDLTLASEEVNGNPRCFYASQPYIRRFASPWYSALCAKREFSDRVAELYQKEFLPVLEEYLQCGIAQKADEISCASAMDDLRWHGDSADSRDDILDVREFLAERVEFLSSAWVDGTEYCSVLLGTEIDYDSGTDIYEYHAVEYGTKWEEIPTPKQLQLGGTVWYIQETGEIFDPGDPITADLILTAIGACSWTICSAPRILSFITAESSGQAERRGYDEFFRHI